MRPGILRQAIDIAAFLPVRRFRRGRSLHQRVQTLIGGRIVVVVEAIEIQRRLQGTDILLRLDLTRLVGTIHDARYDNRREDTQDDHDHHHLDEGETGGLAFELSCCVHTVYSVM